ncbi:dihydrodipicolinate synthase family protein, partial [Streptococcus suis]
VNLSQKPVILYDNLARTGTGLDFKGWQEVLDLPQVIGVKNLSEKSWIAPLKARYPYLHFYAGGEEELLSNIEAGCTRLSS